MHNKYFEKLIFLFFFPVLCGAPAALAQQIQQAAKPPQKATPEPVRSVPTGRLEKSEKQLPPAALPTSIKGPRISAIDIVGQKKIEKEAILAKLISQVGGVFSDKQVSEDIEALHKMGFFNQIEVSKEVQGLSVKLEYKIIEKPQNKQRVMSM